MYYQITCKYYTLTVKKKNSLTEVENRMAMTRDQGEGMADGEMLTNGHELTGIKKFCIEPCR